MATGSLRFRTALIEELPTTQTRQAPGFAWVAVSGPLHDPSKNWGTTNRKRARNAGNIQTETQREAVSAKQQEKIDRKLRDLNSDGGKEVAVPVSKKTAGGGSNAQKAGKTTNTKKILASGKTFAHYLDDEEAEIARLGKREIDLDTAVAAPLRPSKTPVARRKSQRDESVVSGSPAPSATSMLPPGVLRHSSTDAMDVDGTDDRDLGIPPIPSQAEMEALLNATPLTYNEARSAPPPANAPPPRRFCEICGYWGKVRCMKCGVMTCSVACKDAHDEHKCLKFYA
jgi:zinc finger HIT domain-containing protein 1